MKSLIQPHQNWMRRLITWTLSKPAIVAVFVAIMGWVGQAKADWGQEYVPFDPINHVVDTFQHTREVVFIAILFLMIVSLVLVLFKKISWYSLFSFFMWVLTFTLFGIAVDYVTEIGTYETVWDVRGILNVIIPIFAIVFIPCLLPFLVSSIRYKFHKIDKKVFKHHLFIWLMSGLMLIAFPTLYCTYLYLLN